MVSLRASINILCKEEACQLSAYYEPFEEPQMRRCILLVFRARPFLVLVLPTLYHPLTDVAILLVIEPDPF